MSLSCLVFITDRTLSDQPSHVSIVFYGDHTCMIGHVGILSSFCDKPHSLLSIMIVQFQFWRRLHLYDQSRHFPFALCLRSYPIESVMIVQFHFRHKADLYDRLRCCPFLCSLYHTLVWLVKLLSYLLFMIDRILFDRSF